MKEIKDNIKAVIFDMDGTIINTERVWQGITFTFLDEAGIKTFTEKDLEVLRSLSGMGLHPASAAVKEHFNLPHEVHEISQRKEALANQAFEQDIKFIEGFEAFHAQLREHGIPSSIATNATPENLAQLTTTMQFEKFFGDKLFCIGHVGFVPKPDPKLFLYAAEQLGVKPEECVVFEDSIHGFRAAQAAGMRCIAVKNDHNQHLLDMVHDHINSYHEAVEVLKRLAAKQQK